MTRGLSLLLMIMFVLAIFLLREPAKNDRLKICGFAGMIPQEILTEFTEETGIEVDYFSCIEFDEAETKLLAGEEYDLIIVSAWPFFQRTIKLNLLQKINYENIDGFENIDSVIWGKIDPEIREYGVIFVWGSIGIGLNQEKLHEINSKAQEKFGRKIKYDGVNLLIDPEMMSVIAEFGKISMLDSPVEMVTALMYANGIDPKTCSYRDIYFIFNLLREVRKYISRFDSSGMVQGELLDGSIVLCQSVSDDIERLVNRYGKKILYAHHSDAKIIWADLISITRKSKNIEKAEKLISFLIRKNTNHKLCKIVGGYSVIGVNKEKLDLLKNAHTLQDVGIEKMRIIRRLWLLFKEDKLKFLEV